MKQFFQILLLIAVMCASSYVQAQTVYVNASASGANNGTSWTNAYTNLDAALAGATAGTEIWVASGIYRPSNPNPNNSFTVASGVKLYGGFAGTETMLSERNFNSNIAVLSGDISGDDVTGNFSTNRVDNAKHVVIIENTNPSERAILDGFRIQGGHTSDVSTDPEMLRHGGGVFAAAKLTVRNCLFTDNFGRAGASLAAISTEASGLMVDNCTFNANNATQQSAGIFIRNLDGADINRCIFSNNTTNRGSLYPLTSTNVVVDSCLFDSNNAGANNCGGMFTFQTSFTLTNSTFQSNTGNTSPAMYNDGRMGSHFFTIDNCIFDGNISTANIGAMYNFQASFLLKNSIFRNNKSKAFATMYNDGRDDEDYFVIDNCLFENNIVDDGNPNASTFGGAISNWQATYLLKNSTFVNNEADNGGAIYNDGRSFNSEAAIDSCIFQGNKGKVYGGGGVYFWKSNVDLGNTTFMGNSGENTAGAIYTGDSCVYNFHNCVFDGNMATFGGGVSCYGSANTGTFTGCTFVANEAVTSGGALINGFTSNVTLSDCTFSQNNAGNAGGAISNQNESTNLNIERCVFSENNAALRGGAMNISSGVSVSIDEAQFLGNSGDVGGAIRVFEDTVGTTTLAINNAVFRDNIAFTQAGALNVDNSDVGLSNCLFASNLNLSSTGGAGGAISNNATEGETANIVAINCTFGANFAPLGASIAQFDVGDGVASLTLQNCIVAGDLDNYAIEAGNPSVTSLGGNLCSDATLTPYLTGTNDVNEMDPLFNDVSVYDFHVPTNSPAIDIGIASGAPATDLDGNPRINEPDAGCYENQSVVGVFEAPKTKLLGVMPNPAVDFAQLSLEHVWNGAVTIEVVSTTGAIMRTLAAEKQTDNWQFRLDVKDLPTGTYIAKVLTGDTLYVGKIVKR